MEHERCDKHTPIQFRCKKILLGGLKADDQQPAHTQMKENEEEDQPGNCLASPTPEKPPWRSKAKGATSYVRKEKHHSLNTKGGCATIQSETVNPESTRNEDSLLSDVSGVHPSAVVGMVKREAELPEKYKALANLFSRMESSIRFIRLLKKVPTFQNICTQVEVLSKRKLLCSHLAQMKYVFPEAIVIEKVLIHEKNLCMKPDMKITLALEVVGSSLDPNQSSSMALCQAFHARLSEFLITHPENADIPEAVLPEPFNQRCHINLHYALMEGSPFNVSQQTLPLSSASHLSSCFDRRFSKKAMVPETELTRLLASPASMVSMDIDGEGKENTKSPRKEDNLRAVSFVKSPGEFISTTSHGFVSRLSDSTPAKCESKIDVLTAETPALRTPKRPIPTTEEKLFHEAENPVGETKSTGPVRRALIYSASNTDGSLSDETVCTTEQSKTDSVIKESQESRGKQQELLAILDTVCLLSRSANCTLITKQELVHKIISNNLDIEETSEVEEQLGMLEELIPYLIGTRPTATGELLYSIKQTLDPESVRAKLVEAI